MSTDVTPVVKQQLYRLYGADGELLYIGISYSAIARYAQHKASQPWIGDVTRVEIETHECSRKEIEQIERAAIIDEKPAHNVTHNAPRRPTDTYAVVSVGGRVTARRGTIPPNAKILTPHWICDGCRGPAKYIQCTRDDERNWHCVCKRCDNAANPSYWIDAARIKSQADINEWTTHLSHKNWFSPNGWHAMVKRAWRGGK